MQEKRESSAEFETGENNGGRNKTNWWSFLRTRRSYQCLKKSAGQGRSWGRTAMRQERKCEKKDWGGNEVDKVESRHQ